jgi:hypothetical protein
MQGVTYFKQGWGKRKGEVIELPVLPSDHYGLLCTLRQAGVTSA